MPSYYYFIFFLPFLYLFYLIAVYFCTRVPYVKTDKKYLPIIFAHLNITKNSTIYDLGCGAGYFLFAAEKYEPKKIVGYELSPLHACWGKLKIWFKKSAVKIYYQNFFKANISDADIIYLYLVPSVLNKIWLKIKKECHAGTQIICLGSPLNNETVAQIITMEPDKKNSSLAYLYQLN